MKSHLFKHREYQRKFEDIPNDVNVDHYSQDLGLWSLFAKTQDTQIPRHSMKNNSRQVEMQNKQDSFGIWSINAATKPI